jgi:Ca2+-binding RTX toxin-like protein
VAGLLVRWTSFPFDFFSARHSTMRALGCARQLRRNDMAVITGDANDNVLRGLSSSDTVYGLDGNDTLTGINQLIGYTRTISTLYGGAGDDTYNFTQDKAALVHLGTSYGKSIIEQTDQGLDTFNLTVTVGGGLIITDLPNVETFNIYGNVLGVLGTDKNDEISIHPTHAYSDPNDSTATQWEISGGGGNDTLWGSDFSDRIMGDYGSDVMLGGKGDDIYEVDVKSDIVIEMGGGGHDRINCTAREYNLQINVEDLYADGINGATGLNFNGNVGNNHMEFTGDYDHVVKSGSGDDYVSTAGGNDYLIGGTGNDTLVGGLGNDGYRTDIGNFGKDVITDAGGADDSLDLMGLNPEQIWFSQVGNDLKIYNIDSPTNNVTVQNWFSDANARLETIYANGKSLESFRLNDLISVMSDFTRPNTSTETVNPVLNQAIQADWR